MYLQSQNTRNQRKSSKKKEPPRSTHRRRQMKINHTCTHQHNLLFWFQPQVS